MPNSEMKPIIAGILTSPLVSQMLTIPPISASG